MPNERLKLGKIVKYVEIIKHEYIKRIFLILIIHLLTLHFNIKIQNR